MIEAIFTAEGAVTPAIVAIPVVISKRPAQNGRSRLEQGKETVRLDKVNQALAMFGKEAVPGKKEE